MTNSASFTPAQGRCLQLMQSRWRDELAVTRAFRGLPDDDARRAVLTAYVAWCDERLTRGGTDPATVPTLERLRMIARGDLPMEF